LKLQGLHCKGILGKNRAFSQEVQLLTLKLQGRVNKGLQEKGLQSRSATASLLIESYEYRVNNTPAWSLGSA